jgi:hypothetical protein
MSSKVRIPATMRNPRPCVAIDDEVLGKLIGFHGWDLGVVFYYKEGEEGGAGCTSAGFGLRNARMAQEFQRRIMEVIGETQEDKAVKAELDKELADAQEEMSEGATISDNPVVATEGRKLIMPTVLKKRERDGRPNRSVNIKPKDAVKAPKFE